MALGLGLTAYTDRLCPCDGAWAATGAMDDQSRNPDDHAAAARLSAWSASASAAPRCSSFVALIIFGALLGLTDLFMNAEASAIETDLARPVFASFHGSASLGWPFLRSWEACLPTLDRSMGRGHSDGLSPACLGRSRETLASHAATGARDAPAFRTQRRSIFIPFCAAWSCRGTGHRRRNRGDHVVRQAPRSTGRIACRDRRHRRCIFRTLPCRDPLHGRSQPRPLRRHAADARLACCRRSGLCGNRPLRGTSA